MGAYIFSATMCFLSLKKTIEYVSILTWVDCTAMTIWSKLSGRVLIFMHIPP